MKRLFVQPAHRAQGRVGQTARRALIVSDARAIGYADLKLDTLDWMTDARALYAKLGFRECAPYYDNPIAGRGVHVARVVTCPAQAAVTSQGRARGDRPRPYTLARIKAHGRKSTRH